MGKNAKPERPGVPEFQSDPRVSQGIDQLFGLGTDAANLDLSGPLAETIETSPQMTSLFLEGLRAELEPIFRDERQQTINTLAAEGKLGGSTLTSEMGRIESDLQNRYVTQSSQFGINDINRAMAARQNIYGQGLNTIGQATGFAESSEARKNQFALTNFENELGMSILDQPEQTGGLGGALAGAGGGALLGGGLALAAAPFTAGASLAFLPAALGAGALGGGLIGGFSPKGTGTGLLSGGVSSAGGMMPTSNYRPSNTYGNSGT